MTPVTTADELPPHGRGGRSTWERVLGECRKRPGVWVVVAEKRPSANAARSMAAFLRRRNNGEGRWEFRSRTQFIGGRKVHRVWGRWLGRNS